jgi:hypothetical protein
MVDISIPTLITSGKWGDADSHCDPEKMVHRLHYINSLCSLRKKKFIEG